MNDVQTRAERALRVALEKLGADSGTIHIKQPDHKILNLVASQRIPASLIERVREVPWGKGMAGVAAQRATPVDFCNIQDSASPDIHPKAKAIGLRGAICAPMMLGSEVVGTIGIGCGDERTFTAEEIQWLMDFGRDLAKELVTPTMAG